MIRKSLLEIFDRDLLNLKKEIESYTHEGNLWVLSGEIKNTAGNLCLHLIGNLKHFIGAVLGKSGYVRDREAEFSLKDVPRSELFTSVEEAREIVHLTLSQLEDESLSQEYPIEVFQKRVNTTFFLIHLAAHLNYHLGQVNYHRRLLG